MENEFSISSLWESNKILLKGLIIGVLVLVMLIPNAFISELVREREQRQQEVIKEVSGKWANEQTIVGPLLFIPYREVLTDKDGKITVNTKQAFFLPDRLQINGKIDPQLRHRSLYDVSLYSSAINISGAFDPLDLQHLGIAPGDVLWEECRLVMGIDDARGLEDNVALKWNNAAYTLDAGIPGNATLTEGMSAVVKLDSGSIQKFTINMRLKGSSHLFFTPVGKTTEVSLSSTWKDPAFDGMYLPTQTPDISDKGFSARWKILHASRSYPQSWKDGAYSGIEKSAFGVKLLQPTDSYAKTQRSVKYTILFISLSFAVFFFIEILQKRPVHPLQYLLVAFALCIFYTLLLSISEHTGFDPAYLIASAATVLLIGWYVKSIFKAWKIALGFSLALAGLYTYIFILIQLQDHALLFGSIGLFVILAVIMYYSRRINWYGTPKHDTDKILGV